MRIFLLRVLIASWMIPLMWTIGFMFASLIFGVEEAFDGTKDITNTLWNGE